MKIHISKELQPVVIPLVQEIKILQEYNISNYKYKDFILEAPSTDLNLESAMSISRVGAAIDGFEIWFEIPDLYIDASVPEGVSFQNYLDYGDPSLYDPSLGPGDPSIMWRAWSDISEYADGSDNTMRYYQPSNNGTFNWNDVEIIQDAGYTVYDKKGLFIRINGSEYSNIDASDYTVLETIPYIDQNWKFGYFDMVHAHIRINEIYTAKAGSDALRWAASSDEEKEILVRWNVVGINRASSLLDPSWSEARQLKELGRKYREFHINIKMALNKRFDDWYSYLNLILSGTGKSKFANDWNWALKDEYNSRYLSQFELGDVNLLIDFNNNTLGTYVDADFIGSTITSTQFVNGLEKVLSNKEYFI